MIEAFGNEKGLLAGVKVKNLKTGEISTVEVGGNDASWTHFSYFSSTNCELIHPLGFRLLDYSLQSGMSQHQSSWRASWKRMQTGTSRQSLGRQRRVWRACLLLVTCKTKDGGKPSLRQEQAWQTLPLCSTPT